MIRIAKSRTATLELRRNARRLRSEPPAARLDRACRQVESLFINELLNVMERQSFGGGILGDGVAGQVMRAQRNAALAEEMGRRGALGLARMLYEEFAREVGDTDDIANDAAHEAERTGREEI